MKRRRANEKEDDDVGIPAARNKERNKRSVRDDADVLRSDDEVALDMTVGDDCLLEICMRVSSYQDLVRLAMTSSTMMRLAGSDAVWRPIYRRTRGRTETEALAHLLRIHPTIDLDVTLREIPEQRDASRTRGGDWMRAFIATDSRIIMKRNLARAEGQLQEMIDILAGVQRHEIVRDRLRWWVWPGNREESAVRATTDDDDDSDHDDPLTDEDAPWLKLDTALQRLQIRMLSLMFRVVYHRSSELDAQAGWVRLGEAETRIHIAGSFSLCSTSMHYCTRYNTELGSKVCYDDSAPAWEGRTWEKSAWNYRLNSSIPELQVETKPIWAQVAALKHHLLYPGGIQVAEDGLTDEQFRQFLALLLDLPEDKEQSMRQPTPAECFISDLKPTYVPPN